jgi:hypothetical protein
MIQINAITDTRLPAIADKITGIVGNPKTIPKGIAP